jgi:cytochrome c oxidase subunit III
MFMSDAHASTHLAHHFESLEQQKQAASLGMWVFIAQEIMFFGGLFLGYTVYRHLYPGAFAAGSHELSIAWGGFNTVVLILSSLTVALAVRAGHLGRNPDIIRWLIATMVLGTVFLGVKAIEYHGKWEHHLIPGAHFHYDAAHAAGANSGKHVTDAFAGTTVETDKHAVTYTAGNVQIFFAFYFAMTGMHALHMVIGIGLMVWLMGRARRREFASDYNSPIELFGLYWHFVDIVWIFLFPLLYLIERHVQ